MQPRVFVEKGKDPRVRLKGFGLFIYLFILLFVGRVTNRVRIFGR